jgi:hypothetical protein
MTIRISGNELRLFFDFLGYVASYSLVGWLPLVVHDHTLCDTRRKSFRDGHHSIMSSGWVVLVHSSGLDRSIYLFYVASN